MTTLIKDRAITEDSWQRVSDDAPVPEAGDVLVTLDRLTRDSAALKARSGRLGVVLQADNLAEDLSDHVEALSLVAVDFPKYTDGRSYSIARLLRDRYGYKGELRAVGNVLRDQLFYMLRCGIDAFELQEGKDAEEALAAFDEFSVTYQAGADERRPLYRRGLR